MKRELSPQEKRTIRIAGIALGVYLVLFCGFLLWKGLETRRAAYRDEVAEAQGLREKLEIYKDKAALIGDLMERYHMDPTMLARTNVVAEASAALQKAAMAAGINPGTIRETPAQGTAREVASIQFEGSGRVEGLMSLLYHLPALGYPLLLDEMQITSDPRMPGGVKFNLTIAVLDFEKWSQTQEDHAGA